MHILIIEDDSFYRKFYATKLQERGHTVDVAVDGEEGLQKIAQLKPEVVLMDMIMPKKNGFEVLTALSQDENLKKIPVIVFSSLNQEQDIAKAKQLGAADFVNKTLLDFDGLVNKLTQVTQK